MNKKRAKMLQEISEKMGNIFISPLKSMHDNHRQRFFKNHDFGHAHAHLLFAVQTREDGISVKDLAEKLHVTPGAISQTVDKLVEKKMLARSEDENDRRFSKISLTNFARNRFDKVKERYLTSIGNGFDDFTDQELEEFVNLLKKIKIS